MIKFIGDKIDSKRPVFEVNKKMVFEGEETIVTTLCWERDGKLGDCETVLAFERV